MDETSSGSQRTYAVVGATGQQGGAVVRSLLSRQVRVRGLTRSVDSDAARALVELGAEVVAADTAEQASLRTAFADVDAVFAMTTMAEDGPAGEIRMGKRIGDAARAAGVPRIVYSSVGGAERQTGIPHFESKYRVEQHLATLGLPVVVIRPTFFMENLLTTGPAGEDGEVVVRLPFPAGVPLQMVAVTDIGELAATALLDPDAVPGGAVEIAGDELTGEQVAAAFGDRVGLPARYEGLPTEVLGDDADMVAMFNWFVTRPAYQADFALTRRLAPEVHDFPAWLETIGWGR